VQNREDVVKLLSIFDGTYNCGISMCTFIKDIPYLLYLAFDFDSDILEDAWEDASKLYNYMSNIGYDITINFSGYRGFHCLLSVVPKYYTRNQIHAAHTYYKNRLNLKTCDVQIFGDVRRLIRIPGSSHAGKFKKVKGKGWKRIGEGSYCSFLEYSKGELYDIDEHFEDKYPEYIVDNDSINHNGNKHKYPCIEKYINEREPSQIIRYSYVAYYLNDGMTPEEIIDKLESEHSDGKLHEWDDWDLRYTSNQVHHINGGNYHALMCKNLQSLGYCLESECEYYHKDWKDKVKLMRNYNDKIL